MTPLRPWTAGLLLLLSAASLAACSSKKGTQAEQDAQRSWGGEVIDETDGMAKPVDPAATETSQATPAEEPTKPRSTDDYRPVVPDAPPVQTQEKPVELAKGIPSAWGSSDTECGTPLPKRAAPNKAAAEALRQARAASDRGDDATARAQLTRALSADARAFEAAYNLGVLADRSGQSKVALQYYAKALAIQPDYELAVEGSARIYVRETSAAQAVSFVQPIASKWQCNLYLLALYAEVLSEAGRLDEADATARQALRRDERFVPAMVALAKASMKRGRIELADSILAQALAVSSAHAEIHYLQAQRHLAEGRGAQALASYRKAVELRPDNAEARAALGLQYLAAGNYPQAVEQLEVVVRLVPNVVNAHVNLGDAYRASKRWQDAKRELDTALRMQSNLPEAHYNMGLLYLDAGENLPGLSKLESLQRAQLELTTYREQMGPRLTKDDPSIAFLADVARQIEREQRRIERENARKQRDTARGAAAGEGTP